MSISKVSDSYEEITLKRDALSLKELKIETKYIHW